MHFALRTSGDLPSLTATVRQVVHELDSNLPVTEVSSQAARAEETLGQERLSARLFGFFGGLAMLLAAIGLFGVLAYSVAQRTNEIGIRMALGARSANVLRLVIWQGMKLVLLGVTLGALAGFVLIRLFTSQYFANSIWQQMVDQLYGVKPGDPVTLFSISAVSALIALIACWLPARKAARVDPLVALRCE
ncbi:MAG TPA: FtsX-like permease family protein [Pyrinomonadaceae bacterium]|nr:FtsX-like permease family protein [Pyrinomonadaceae bacterium]